LKFEVNPRGNWYENESGLPVHRVSAEDADAAGVTLFDSKSRKIVTPEQHRSKALDKMAWDRNYGLIFQNRGVSAVGLLPLTEAQRKGSELKCIFYENDLSGDWDRYLDPLAETYVGDDPATTEKEKSNPFAVSVTQLINGIYAAKVIFKLWTSDPKKAREILREVCTKSKAKCLSLDATSERYWCSETAAEFAGLLPVALSVSSENTEHEGEKMKVKTFLGNLAVATIDDGTSALPPVKEVKDDFRLVRREKGGFNNLTDNQGNHGDTFDAYKQSLNAFVSGITKTEATAVAVGHGAEPVTAPSTRMPMRPDDHDNESQERNWT